MSHSYKRVKSKNEQFRMFVPTDLRDVVGLTCWTKSLETTDRTLAAARRAELTRRYKAEVIALRAAKTQTAKDDVVTIVGRTFHHLARVRGSMDAVVAEQLAFLASFVCDSWVEADESVDRRQFWGGYLVLEPAIEIEPVPSIDTDVEREVFKLRARILEGRGIADGLVYQELAATLLARQVFRPIAFVVSYLSSIEPKLDLRASDTFDIAAEAYLRRLAEHSFASWPEGIRNAFPRSQSDAAMSSSLPRPLPTIVHGAVSHDDLRSKSLTEALAYWRRHREPSASAAKEASRAVARFVDLFGDLVVGEITRAHLLGYRNLVMDMPPQVELARVYAAGKTLRTIIDEERARRAAWEAGDKIGPRPERLAPGSVKKDIGAFSQILGKIAADVGDGLNVAARIEVAGYSKEKKGQKRPRLPFTPEMMQTLFASPLFTGCAGRSDAARGRPGGHLYQDELYWPFLFGITAGPRLEEIGQIALSDVHHCEIRRSFSAHVGGHCTFVHITGTGEDQHVKNEESERYVIIHPRLLELGFDDYVARRLASGAKRLFDLEPDADGKFTKGLSQRLNRYIDRVVTDDPRYVFHSLRHEFTDRAEMSEIPARVANTIKGHASATVGDRYGLGASLVTQYANLDKLDLGFINWRRLSEAALNANKAMR